MIYQFMHTANKGGYLCPRWDSNPQNVDSKSTMYTNSITRTIKVLWARLELAK